ncbi:MAG: hypothetical protein H7Z13_15805 [Ferruginibacter sp.]|nr:hypothetical protein [Ferruginibacter sp.]
MIHPKKQEHHIRPYKIAAQSAGLVACIFIFIFMAGKGIPEILKTEGAYSIPFMGLLILPVAGYLISWYKEFAGTLMMLAGGIILLSLFLVKGDTISALEYGLPFILAGCIFLVHIVKRAQLKRNT